MQSYRLVSAAFIHGGILHLLMNMMALRQLGITLEQSLGTLPFIGISLLLTLVSGLIYTLGSNVLYFILKDYRWVNSCAVGYSGVLFAYMVIGIKLGDPNQTRSIFGFFQVPAWIYPWVMLGILQILVPNVSFMGHLAGILSGFMYSFGFLHIFTLSRERILAIERLSCIQNLKDRLSTVAMWYPAPEHSPLPCSLFNDIRDLLSRNVSRLSFKRPETQGYRLGGDIRSNAVNVATHDSTECVEIPESPQERNELQQLL